MITPNKIAKATMSEEKKRTDRIRPFAFYIGRPISYVLTVPFLYTKITPNMVTILSILFAVAGLVINSIFASCLMLSVGWAMFLLWNLFDGVDGNIARYKKQYSKFGTAFDAMGGYSCIICMLFSSGIAAFNTECILDAYLPWGKIALVVCGGFAVIFNIFPRLMMYFVKATVDNKDDVSEADSVTDKEHYGIVKILILNIMAPSDGMLLLLMPAIWLKALDIYTYFYFIVSFLGMMASLFVIFRTRKSKELEKNNSEKSLEELKDEDKELVE